MANPQNPDQKQPPEPPKEQPCDSDYGCEPIPTGPEPPTLKPPTKCEPKCDCPTKTDPKGSCFDGLIAEQKAIASAAERAAKTQADLQQMLDSANKAKETFTREKYEDFKKRWKLQDKNVIDAIEVVTCNVKCWWCVIQCHICPLLYRVREIEQSLEGPSGKLIGEVHSLRDLQYWHERYVAQKERVFARIDAVLKAWNDPATSIETALKANEQIINAVRSMDPADALKKVFFELVPRHLAIAPRPLDTGINQKYIKLCADCDPGAPDDCCGPDVGLPTARQRLIEPQAYIVDPDKYFDLLCCLATQRFQPAKQQVEKARAGLDAVKSQITNLESELGTRLTDILAEYRGGIATPIDCEKYKNKDGGDGCGCDDDEQSEESAS